MNLSERFRAAGIDLQAPPAPQGSYAPIVIVGNTVYVSGTLPLLNGTLETTGVVGDTVSLEEAQRAARQCMVNMFARLATDLGDLERIAQWAKITGFIASTPNFTQQPTIMNTASDLVKELFGDRGVHARSAVGVSSLPLGTPVEIEAILILS
ncbi:MAG: RidA family protein [Ferrimicrobium sp.]